MAHPNIDCTVPSGYFIKNDHGGLTSLRTCELSGYCYMAADKWVDEAEHIVQKPLICGGSGPNIITYNAITYGVDAAKKLIPQYDIDHPVYKLSSTQSIVLLVLLIVVIILAIWIAR